MSILRTSLGTPIVPEDMDEPKLNLEILAGVSLILVDSLGSLGHVPRIL